MYRMTIAELIVTAWSLTVGVADLSARRIPNVLTLGICLIAIAWLLATGHSILGANWQSAILAALISLLLTLPAYALQLLGAGDTKLLLAIALIGGTHLTLLAFVIASILAMIFWIAHSLFSRLGQRLERPKRWIPFGAALSAGLVCAIGMAP